jgi:hypothetical protein
MLSVLDKERLERPNRVDLARFRYLYQNVGDNPNRSQKIQAAGVEFIVENGGGLGCG